jgi:hypothetical protein
MAHVVGRFAQGIAATATAADAAVTTRSTRVGGNEMMDALRYGRYGGTRGAFNPLDGTSRYPVHCPRFVIEILDRRGILRVVLDEFGTRHHLSGIHSHHIMYD